MDVALSSLWLPIVVSAVVVFFASFVSWTFLPHHKVDFTRMPQEDGFLAALKNLGVPPGQYMFPFCSMEDMKDPEKKARWEAGPYGSLYLLAARPSFLRNLGLVFVFYLVVGTLVAYVGSVALPRGADYLKVFQVCGTAAILGYACGQFPGDVFGGKRPRTMLNNVADGIAYGLLTAGVFGWLWP